MVIQQTELRFRRVTDRGVIQCQVSVPVGYCDQCGFRHVDAAADAAIEAAARRAYEELGAK
ncbi:hypothetical protein [Limobrevibacterium gyesilva]|uniref:Uncharacterized protein n=1 Tax=Limobrevibacterium gyesilva TaxID=2991712 RepID=A0AA42CFX9_9PROT|nr:hypothetical protein [Limobrevibacterium gyesilva]MCW3475411.1 hypothetical protein [Limobrevibacterium gyesilva]